MKKLVVGLGEVLWDMLPGRTYLGGAPANFAYITNLLGDNGVVASRVGADDLGRKAAGRMQALGVPITHVQCDASHFTGVVKVEVDAKGIARFEIEAPSAWDFFEWTEQWQDLAQKADAVCFGSLAQRSEQSRETIRRFLRATRPGAVRVFDVNLRQPFYSGEVLTESTGMADIIKMNDEEVPKVMDLIGLRHVDEISSTQQLIELYDLKLVCVTRGSRGSLLVSRTDSCESGAIEITVADTIGAGDAFTAALVHEYLRGAPLTRMNRFANRVGAWVASKPGPTPIPESGELEQLLADNG